MPALQILTGGLSAAEIGERLFGGDILVFAAVPPLVEAVRMARQMIRAELADDDPETAERRRDPADFVARIQALRRRAGSDETLLAAMREALGWTGLAADDTYWDRLRLRAVPSRPTHRARRILPLAPHRDVWASNLAQQINWWTPIHPVAASRTILLYPAYWRRPVANDSADWDFHVLKRLMAEGRAGAYPLLPTTTQAPPPDAALALVIRPGDLLCFSGNHLHGSAADDSGITRFNLDTRSVCLSHCRAGVGAPNCDGAAPRVTPEWFRRISDGAPLAAALA
jgi:hypothetical protein